MPKINDICNNGPFLSVAVAFLHVCTMIAAPCCHGNFIVYSVVICEDFFMNGGCEESLKTKKQQALQTTACHNIKDMHDCRRMLCGTCRLDDDDGGVDGNFDSDTGLK